MMIGILADAAAASDPMISGNWLIGLIGAISTAAAAIIGKFAGQKAGENSREVTLKKPVPTVVTREEPQWATKPDLDEHIERTDKHFAEVWNRFETERHVARESANNIHRRLDKQSEATAGVQASLNEVKETTGKLLDIALNRKPGTRQ